MTKKKKKKLGEKIIIIAKEVKSLKFNHKMFIFLQNIISLKKISFRISQQAEINRGGIL